MGLVAKGKERRERGEEARRRLSPEKTHPCAPHSKNTKQIRDSHLTRIVIKMAQHIVLFFGEGAKQVAQFPHLGPKIIARLRRALP